MNTTLTDLLQQNINNCNCDDFQEMSIRAVEQILNVYNSLNSFVNTCILLSNTSNAHEQLEFIVDRLGHNNYFNDYHEFDTGVYNILYLDRDVACGELDKCILTLYINENKVCISNSIGFGIKGEDYPMYCSIEDVVYTLDKYSKLC